MDNMFFLLTDREGKNLFEKFQVLHPDGSEFVLKLLLKFYIKFAGWHKKKGRDPIIAFQDLIEREIKGKPYISDVERIRYLNEIIESDEETVVDAPKGGGLTKEINELRSLLSMIKQTKMSSQSKLEDFKPGESAPLEKVKAEPKKRKNYRDVRGKAGGKKISF